MDTIEINKDLFCNMITSLFKDIKVDQQVQWLQTYGSNFYTLGLYDYVINAHVISEEHFIEAVNSFWDTEPVVFEEISCEELSGLTKDLFYEKYVSISFSDEKTVADIAFGLEDFEKTPANTYYSPCLFKCIMAQLKLDTTDHFLFTKALFNSKVSIVFVVRLASGLMAFDLSRDPL